MARQDANRPFWKSYRIEGETRSPHAVCLKIKTEPVSKTMRKSKLYAEPSASGATPVFGLLKMFHVQGNILPTDAERKKTHYVAWRKQGVRANGKSPSIMWRVCNKNEEGSMHCRGMHAKHVEQRSAGGWTKGRIYK